MDMLPVALNAIIPLFIMVFTGYFFTRVGLFTPEFLKIANRLVFRFLLPVNMFWTMYNGQSGASTELKAMAFCIGGTLGILLIAALVVPQVCKDDRQRGVLIQDMFRGNFVVYGTSICLRMFGDSANTLVALLTGVTIPIYNFCGALVLSYFADRTNGKVPSLSASLISALKNPMFWAPILGALAAAVNLPIPQAICTAIQDIGKTASPMAQLFMGGSFTFAYVGRYWKKLVLISVMRQGVIPAVMLALAIALGFRGYQLGTVLCMFGAPVAVTTFAMTQQIGGDENLAVSAIVTTTCFSCVSLCVFSVILGMLGYF